MSNGHGTDKDTETLVDKKVEFENCWFEYGPYWYQRILGTVVKDCSTCSIPLYMKYHLPATLVPFWLTVCHSPFLRATHDVFVINILSVSGRFFHPILMYLPVTIIAMWITLHKKYVMDTDEGDVPDCEERTIVSSLYHDEGVRRTLLEC